MVLLCGLERTHTFLVPIINPPFADNSPLSYNRALLDADFSPYRRSVIKIVELR
jgi:hypothetical protein